MDDPLFALLQDATQLSLTGPIEQIGSAPPEQSGEKLGSAARTCAHSEVVVSCAFRGLGRIWAEIRFSAFERGHFKLKVETRMSA